MALAQRSNQLRQQAVSKRFNASVDLDICYGPHTLLTSNRSAFHLRSVPDDSAA
jgi:hypothetical protein